MARQNGLKVAQRVPQNDTAGPEVACSALEEKYCSVSENLAELDWSDHPVIGARDRDTSDSNQGYTHMKRGVGRHS